MIFCRYVWLYMYICKFKWREIQIDSAVVFPKWSLRSWNPLPFWPSPLCQASCKAIAELTSKICKLNHSLVPTLGFIGVTCWWICFKKSKLTRIRRLFFFRQSESQHQETYLDSLRKIRMRWWMGIGANVWPLGLPTALAKAFTFDILWASCPLWVISCGMWANCFSFWGIS